MSLLSSSTNNMQSRTERLLADKFGLIGSSPAMQEAIERLIRVAPTDIPVLLTGESGTGKEVFARAVHGLSKRNNRPMLSLNCGALPETLLESELFGSKKGAFTGAVENRKGYFESADSGTLFLDEIGETTPALQVKLLRVLETGEFSRLGSSEVLHSNVRIIAATNRSLEEEVRRGNFRQDLYYRLNSFVITLPPLREHIQDIPLLVDTFARRTATRLQVAYEGIDGDALTILQNLPWEGNIRELRNMIETMVTLHKGSFITPTMLREFIPPALNAAPVYYSSSAQLQTLPSTPHISLDMLYAQILELRRDVEYIKMVVSTSASSPINSAYLLPTFGQNNKTEEAQYAFVDDAANDEAAEVSAEQPIIASVKTELSLKLSDVERSVIIEALRCYIGNRRKAADALGISERTLYRKINEHNITEQEFLDT